jgi:transcriptional regulator with XRE-family HTH domain
MAPKPKETPQQRAVRLRVALDIATQQAMAEHLGVSFNRWNNVERGMSLGHDLAVIMCQRIPGLTLDWLYFGRVEGISMDIAQRLGEMPKTGKSRRA